MVGKRSVERRGSVNRAGVIPCEPEAGDTGRAGRSSASKPRRLCQLFGTSQTWSRDVLLGYSFFTFRLRPLPLLLALVVAQTTRPVCGWTARQCVLPIWP